MKTLFFSLTVLTLAACGRGAVDPADPVNDSTNRLSEQNTCVSAGGTCVGISPNSCASGQWGDPASCGDGIGVGCCLAEKQPVEPAECTPITLWPGNPAAMYCAGLGYQLDESDCVFADGTRCEQWAFFRGECGTSNSFCNLHGGTLSRETRDFGGWSGTLAVCTVSTGKKCDESLYARSCVCE